MYEKKEDRMSVGKRKNRISTLFLLGALVASFGFTSPVYAREIKIVGSSTVFPFTQAVAEEFTMKGGTAPTLESTGTGGGMKIFCQGVGERYPDITGASREMMPSEKALCDKNGVTDITEILLGYDGIAVTNSRKGKKFSVTREQLYKALASKIPVDGKLVANPNKKWSDIDPSLPHTDIEVYGPPPTSGTRDAFVELVFHDVCKKMGIFKDKKTLKQECTAMRTDGPYIEAGENDNLIVQRLEKDKSAVGIFGYSYLYENPDKLQDVSVDGVDPSMETIASGKYPLARPLFLYVKNAHRKFVKDMDAFLDEYTSKDALGKDGYLAERGLVVKK